MHPFCTLFKLLSAVCDSEIVVGLVCPEKVVMGLGGSVWDDLVFGIGSMCTFVNSIYARDKKMIM